MSPGRFVTVEGIEGAGKSTGLAVLQRCIGSRGLTVVQTREPGGTPLGERLRELLLDHRSDGIADDTELLLMFAARAEHLHQVIEPALAAGSWVVCDRFTDASFAYQGYGRGIDLARIARLEDWVQGERRPDLTLLLDLPVATGLARAGSRSTPDRFERETLAFFERVRAGYLDLAARSPARYRVIDASRDIATVSSEIEAVIGGCLADCGL
jgi:dTMP kinase